MAAIGLGVGVSTVSIVPEAAADGPGEPLRQPGAFAAPPTEVRPKARWWWGETLDPKEIRAEFEAMGRAGFGGAEIAFFGDWATRTQRAALREALKVARERDLALDQTLGAVWPVTTPNTGRDLTSPHRSQEMMYGSLSLVGPGQYRVAPPVAQDLNVHIGTSGPFQPTYGEVPARLVSVTAARVVEEGTPVVYTSPDVPYQPVAPTAPAKSTVLDPASAVDLTDKVGPDGKVAFNPRTPGRWIVFGLWQRPGIQSVMDHFSTGAVKAVTSYLDREQIGSGNNALLTSGADFFEDSLELAFQGVPWTNGFLKEFERRRGYNVAPFAPTLFVQDAYNVPGHDPEDLPNADFEFAGGTGVRVRNDYIQTLSELFREKHLVQFQRWARSHGMSFRAQPYGSVMNGTAAGRTVASVGGSADVESLGAGDPSAPGTPASRRAFDMYRMMSSGVEQGGGREVGSELGASAARNYATSLSEYKALMDKEWAAGVTTPIIHGFAYQEPGAAWPGTDYMFGAIAQSWNHRNFPEWKMWRNLTDYWARGNMVLRSGKPRQDVVLYHDEYHGPSDGSVFDSSRLERAGYTFGFIDREGLTDRRAAGRRVLFPGGPSYRAVVIDTEHSMSGSAARALAKHAANGLAVVVVGPPPTRGKSYTSPRAEDRAVRSAFRAIMSAPRTRRVSSVTEVAAALGRLKVQPAAQFAKRSALMTRQRRTEGVDYWYLWNGGTQPTDLDVSFASTGVPKELDLWSGDISRVAEYRSTDNRTVLPLALAPGETRVVAFDRRAGRRLHVTRTNADRVRYSGSQIQVEDWVGGRKRALTLSNGSRRSVRFGALPRPIVPDSWQLDVRRSAPGADGRAERYNLAQLRDWRSIRGLEFASGTGTYTTNVSLSRNWVSARRGVHLDLGTVWGTVEAYVNGRRVSSAATPHQQYDATWLETAPTMNRIDVSRWLRPGRNTIRVVLTTTLKNAVIGAVAGGAVNPGAAGTSQPYGLGGLVRLRPFARTVLGRASR